MIGRVRVKVCGVSSPEIAEAAARGGADFVGVIFYPPSPRFVAPEKVAALAPRIGVGKVAVSVEPALEALAAHRAMGFDAFQVHFRLDTPVERIAGWSAAVSPEKLWLAPKVPPGGEFPEALLPFAHTFLVDGYQADKFGGTGHTGDWGQFRRLREAHPTKTWILSGGLTPQNIAAALAATEADFVDVNSGVESAPGVKDKAKLSAFLEAVRSAQ